jgi:ATP-dependent Clp protease ATP-binding subunit ClpC
VLGARPLRRLIQNEVEDTLSDEILGGRLNAGDTAMVDLEDGKIVVHAKAAVVPVAKP